MRRVDRRKRLPFLGVHQPKGRRLLRHSPSGVRCFNLKIRSLLEQGRANPWIRCERRICTVHFVELRYQADAVLLDLRSERLFGFGDERAIRTLIADFINPKGEQDTNGDDYDFESGLLEIELAEPGCGVVCATIS